ncbi:MAG: hypothetical protein AB2A00_40515 [Myxococcota bacterium]
MHGGCRATWRIMMGAFLALSGMFLPAPAVASEDVVPLALIIGNNKSLKSERPDLRFADDDALKYALLFRGVTEAAHVHTLTRVDQDSADLFADDAIPVAAPTRASIAHAAEELATTVRALRAEGRRTALYFVFAGHGDVERGRGYMELEDGTLRREDLEQLIHTVGADATHVLLDSCNAFFVIHPRRPGGRTWATPADVTSGLTVDNSDVGVFLSTSADAQVFEWNQLQSGIFSHAVRSGLLGAADANGDDLVTYDELEAFVSTAAEGIRNSLYRPRLYTRSPRQGAVLMDLRGVRARAVTLRGFTGRVTLLHRQGARLLDLHAESGFEPRIHVPVDDATLVAEVRTAEGTKQLREHTLGTESDVTPTMLAAASTLPRGSDAMFEQLFARPYGPRAVARFHASKPGEAASPDVEARLTNQLQVLADDKEQQRLAAFVGVPLLMLVPVPTMLALAVVTVGSVALLSRQTHDRLPSPKLLGGATALALAALGAVVAVQNVITLSAMLPTVVMLLSVSGVTLGRNVEQQLVRAANENAARGVEDVASEEEQDRAARMVAVLSGYDQEARNDRIRNVALAAAALVAGTTATLGGLAMGLGFLGAHLMNHTPPWNLQVGALLASGSALSVGLLSLGVGVGLLLLQSQSGFHAGLLQAATDTSAAPRE